VNTGAQLAALLLDRYDVAVLEGGAFGDAPSALRFRMATSLLYGASDEQRWEALLADDPLALPWIAAALERLGETLRALAA
jgi:aspartate aminotransferase